MDDSHTYTGKFPQSFARSTLDVPKIKIEEMSEYSLLKNSYGSGAQSLLIPYTRSFTFPDSPRAALASRADNKPNPTKDTLVTQRAHDSNNASCSSFPNPSNNTAEGERPVVTLKNGTTYRIIKSRYRPLFYTTPPIPKPRTPTPETCLTGNTESVSYQNNDRSDPHFQRITLVHVGFRKSPSDSQTPEKTTRIQVREKHSSSYSRIASSATRRFIKSTKTHASLAPQKASEHKASHLVSQ